MPSAGPDPNAGAAFYVESFLNSQVTARPLRSQSHRHGPARLSGQD